MPLRVNKKSFSDAKLVLALSCLVICSSLFILIINHKYFHYYGNNYFPDRTLQVGCSLFLVYLGFKLMNVSSFIQEKLLCLVYFFLTMSSIAVLTNAVQLTPFSPIDDKILILESYLPIQLPQLIDWTNLFPTLKSLLNLCYQSLPYQMCFLPLGIILVKSSKEIYKYSILILISSWIGFLFYYFYPTIGPASMLHTLNFSEFQFATGVKFYEIHHHKHPSTLEGGLIAFPSFHVIWAWFCTQLIRGYKYLYFIMLIVNSLLALSCVLLGWHYVIDLVGSLVVILFTYLFFDLFQYYFTSNYHNFSPSRNNVK